jgi:hypothetical protein
MDYVKLVSKIYTDGVDFNPACFNFSEQEARDKKLWRDDRAMPTQAELDAIQIEADKEEQIEAAYNSMVKDVYDELENVFGTRNDVSAQATASTYEAMLKRPANYVTVGGLADEAAVTAYATAKIAEADAYGVFRLNRMAQFEAEKNAILNP